MEHFQGKARRIGILTAGGDCPGLNAAIRGITKAAIHAHGIQVFGILDGFRGLAEDRVMPLSYRDMSGLLTLGGTILGTGRDKLRKMVMDGKVQDMTPSALETIRRHDLDCIVCLGGGGTQKNAYHLQNAGVNVLTLPKTIDNDVWATDVSFGFDTALNIAASAIDRLHTTATSHNRIIVVETMGHKAGWLALGAGLAGGADAIILPEIPYDLQAVGEFMVKRQVQYGRRFSIIAVAEGARSQEEAALKGKKFKVKDAPEKAEPDLVDGYHLVKESLASRLAREIQTMTRTEARVTTLGHVQRGGAPSSADRLLATQLGVAAADLLAAGKYNVMVASQNGKAVPVPLIDVAGRKKLVELDHAWVQTARRIGTNLGVSSERLEQLQAEAY
jgi:ATP-dependent phosphofructokinase / diphosphate-dependent phosphofructokinase